MKNQVIEVLTPEHGAEVIKYWKSRGVDTRGHRGDMCKSDGDTDRYYGVIDGEFGCYLLSEVKKYNAEIIELPETKGYMFHVPTPELSKAVQLRLVDLGYRYRVDVDVIDSPALRYIIAENDGRLTWSDELSEDRQSECEKGSLDGLFYTDKYRRPKKVIELTMQEIAEKLGVDEVKIKP